MQTTAKPDHPGVIAFPPFIALGSGALSAALACFIPLPIASKALCLPVGVVLAIAAGGLVASGAMTLRRGGTNVNPSLPALAIVRGGPFRFTRNPMYLSMCLLHLALGFFLNNWIPVAFTAVLGGVLHYGVVLREERYLEAKFGEPYRDLLRSVRRWI